MNNKELFYFTGQCLALDEKPEFKEEIIYKCNNNFIDWEAFVFLCSNQLVLPAIYSKFKNHNLTEHLPVVLADHLHEIYELNIRRNKNILSQIEEITRVLNRNSIHPIFLKGAANLLDNLYPDIGERILADIDFLVSENNYLITAELLEQNGYSNITETPDYIDIKDSKHYPRLIHPNFEAVIEIHRIPVDKKYLKWFNSETIDRDKKTPCKTAGYFIPSDRHKIIHNFIHSQLSDEGYLYGVISLRDIYDLLLLSKRIPFNTILPEFKKKRIAKAYFTLADMVLSTNGELFSQKNFAYWVLKRKLALNLNSSAFYHMYRGAIFVAQRIFTGYLGRPTKAIFYKNERHAIIRRLQSPEWINHHKSLYTNFFNIDRKKNKWDD